MPTRRPRINKSKIDYLALAESTIGRVGVTLNICTGCEHWHMPEICALGKNCYAYKMVTQGWLKGSPSYPYGFAPTFHPERVRKIGGKPKLLFLNDMGEIGGDWDWKVMPGWGVVTPLDIKPSPNKSPAEIAYIMREFALANSQHIILLLTKRPEWYGLVEWPANVYCGFTATNNEEILARWLIMKSSGIFRKNQWASLEPWLDEKAPEDWPVKYLEWMVIGGLSGPHARPVSAATLRWLLDKSVQAKRFTKDNAISQYSSFRFAYPREYPDEWKVK